MEMKKKCEKTERNVIKLKKWEEIKNEKEILKTRMQEGAKKRERNKE